MKITESARMNASEWLILFLVNHPVIADNTIFFILASIMYLVIYNTSYLLPKKISLNSLLYPESYGINSCRQASFAIINFTVSYLFAVLTSKAPKLIKEESFIKSIIMKEGRYLLFCVFMNHNFFFRCK